MAKQWLTQIYYHLNFWVWRYVSVIPWYIHSCEIMLRSLGPLGGNTDCSRRDHTLQFSSWEIYKHKFGVLWHLQVKGLLNNVRTTWVRAGHAGVLIMPHSLNSPLLSSLLIIRGFLRLYRQATKLVLRKELRNFFSPSHSIVQWILRIWTYRKEMTQKYRNKLLNWHIT